MATLGAEAEGVIHFDFESGDLQGWIVVEGSFGEIVSDRATFHNRPDTPYNKQGTFYFSTVQLPDDSPDDSMTGIVESPVFVLDGPKVSFLISGGEHENTYVALCLQNGEEVERASGKNDETMFRVVWDVPELVGKAVFLRVVDHNTGGWGHIDLDDFLIDGHIDEEATKARYEARRLRDLERKRTALVESCQPLRLAIVDMIQTFGERYPRGNDFLARLDVLAGNVSESELDELEDLTAAFDALRREALIANPLVSGHPILFVVRNQYNSHYHAIDTLFHTGEFNVDIGKPHASRFKGGGALKTIDLGDGGRVTTLVESPEGVVRDPDVHFDGKKIVFALRNNAGEDYHVYEINADGSGLRQLTCAEGVCDFDPFYLPDDNVCFSSTRDPKYNMCSRDSAANLFRMEPDGANIHQITKNTLFDNHGDVLPDGRILYARWEYVDRNFGDAHGLWTVNPDGTNQAVYWGNNTASPGAVFNAHVIPGTQQVLCVLGMHHCRLWGALAIIDRSLGLDGRAPVLRTWPPEARDKIRDDGPFDCDGFVNFYPKYEDPWPLNDKYFLCSRMTLGGDKSWTAGDAKYGHEMGLYLVDVFGNELLLHVEGPGCYDPIPLAPRKRPPHIPARREFNDKQGYFYIADVYEGTHMDGVERGTVKRLRVVESPEKRHWSRGSWFGQGYTAPGMNWHSLENKRILGSVPVEEDGSAYFAVPSTKFVYFQLLDENGMMVQSMRSGTVAQPGETVGCAGCHEDRLSAPANGRGLAWSKEPRQLEPWHGEEPRLFGFMAEVQPIFTEHCSECHDYGKKAGEKLNLAPDRTLTFNTAYTELWRKKYVTCVGGGPAPVQQARSWGSHASKVAHVLLKGHNGVKLTEDERDAIFTWLDLNAPYYPTYACAYPESVTGRCPLDNEQIARLSKLTGVPFADTRSFHANPGPMVSFDRPELSPCLTKLEDKDSAEYREALAIIEAGKEMLAQRPRADMTGFAPCPKDLEREQRYGLRQRVELRNWEAIRNGEKVYDKLLASPSLP